MMEENPESPGRIRKPRPVVVIGWTFVISSGMGFLLTLMTAVTIIMTSIVMMEQEIFSQLPFREVMAYMVRHKYILILGQVFFSTFFLWAGIEFLRMKEWSRKALEWSSWLTLVLSFVKAYYQIIYWDYFRTELDAMGRFGGGVEMGTATKSGVIAMVGVESVLLIVVAVTLIYYLRSKEVREAMGG